MSNGLRKRKKKMEPLGYTKEEHEKIYAYSRAQKQKRDMTGNVAYTLRNITFWLLYHKFDFGKTKLTNFAKATHEYEEEVLAGKIDVMECNEQLQKRSHINLQEYAVKIPFNEKCKLAGAENLRVKEDARFIAGTEKKAYQAYMVMVLTVLKKKMHFTEKKLKEFLYWTSDHINSFYRELFDDNDLIVTLAEENGYQL